METRVGIGFDVHRFTPNKPLILGGVKIPWEYGLEGHSDADVLIHAVADAILGTTCAGDIGTLFPDTDPALKNLNSTIILERAARELRNIDGKISWIDIIVITEKPPINPYAGAIKTSLATILDIKTARIGLKAKTCEKLGFIGRREGIAVQAAVTVSVKEDES